jgi:ketosteroid isomerase-like protein
MLLRFFSLLILLTLSISSFAATPEDEILQLDREFSHNFNQAAQDKRVAAWMSYFADNATVPAATPLAGKQALTEHYQKVFSNPDLSLSWEPIKAEVFPGGKMGYTVGKYLAHSKDKDGKAAEETGRYITIWKKQDDGSWKIVADTGSDDGQSH